MKNAIKVYLRDLLGQLSISDPPYYQPLVSDPINQVILSNYDDAVVEAYVKNNTDFSRDAHFHIYLLHCRIAPGTPEASWMATRLFTAPRMFL